MAEPSPTAPPAQTDFPAQTAQESAIEFYCPQCRQPAPDPLACGDCGSLICRRCGAPLERIDELGIG